MENLADSLSSLDLSSTSSSKKSILRWNMESKLFLVEKMTGNHWHTMGFPIDGQMYATPEEAIFLLDNEQATVFVDGSSTPEDAFEFLLKEGNLNLDELRDYIQLKKLGFIVWRPIVPYLKDTQYDGADCKFVLFKPNSKFQKRQPTGFFGLLNHVGADSNPLTKLGAVRDEFLSVGDEMGQVYLEVSDITDKLLNKNR